jgi:hypothetical protein
MRPVLAALALVACSAASAAPPTVIRLYEPGVLDRVAWSNPVHFKRISDILSLASEMPCHSPQFAREVKVKHDAATGGCGLALLTSFPAKRRLQFTIEDTRYLAVVTMADSGGKVMPAR